MFEAVNQIPIRYEQVPSGVIDAVLAVEDESFFEHKGINAKSLLRAVLANVSAGEVRQGGSTITQQLVGLNYLPATPSANDKIVEATYAVELEKKLTKQQILERYLNSVYFGNGSYGIQAAAEMYFNKNVDQLTMVEGAFLAGLIRAPSRLRPVPLPRPVQGPARAGPQPPGRHRQDDRGPTPRRPTRRPSRLRPSASATTARPAPTSPTR